jgi:hypothetical protein
VPVATEGELSGNGKPPVVAAPFDEDCAIAGPPHKASAAKYPIAVIVLIMRA